MTVAAAFALAVVFDFGTGHLSSSEYLSILSSGKPFPPGKLSLWNGVYYGSGYYMSGLMREDKESGYNYYNIIINPDENKVWHFAPDKRSDDIFFNASTVFYGTSYSGEWVSVLPTDKLIDAIPDIENLGHYDFDKQTIDQIKSVSIEDNPVLILFTFK